MSFSTSLLDGLTGSGGGATKFVEVWNQQSSGINGQSFTANTPTTVIFNQIITNISGVTLTSNEIVGLPIASYYAYYLSTSSAPSQAVSKTVLKIVDNSSSVYGFLKTNRYTGDGTQDYTGFFIKPSTQNVKLVCNVSDTVAGAGAASPTGEPCIYNHLHLIQLDNF
jgi:hypothetical protein